MGPMRVRGIWLSTLMLVAGSACGPESAPVASVTLEPGLARVYLTTCASCHARPGIGVPLTGLDADWRERREKGMDVLLANTVNGSLGMPPLGTCGLCSESDFRSLIRYMAGLP